ncbi:DNA-dependent RNA polymerase beta' subunit/160 kD subunit [Giardia duodenalis]|uniref:DNA-dependent RNA polymerase beta' subunit/160 kD subunit n=1 Tax=Giardia intestinalis TaxID=5741 RepID=V6TE32_GIAIN|nr:DNA-dependent RNA polymerase beta' subunit/160 kD subunit [Giardia intestinalis]
MHTPGESVSWAYLCWSALLRTRYLLQGPQESTEGCGQGAKEPGEELLAAGLQEQEEHRCSLRISWSRMHSDLRVRAWLGEQVVQGTRLLSKSTPYLCKGSQRISHSNVQECTPNNHSTREVRSESGPHWSCSY